MAHNWPKIICKLLNSINFQRLNQCPPLLIGFTHWLVAFLIYLPALLHTDIYFENEVTLLTVGSTTFVQWTSLTVMTSYFVTCVSIIIMYSQIAVVMVRARKVEQGVLTRWVILWRNHFTERKCVRLFKKCIRNLQNHIKKFGSYHEHRPVDVSQNFVTGSKMLEIDGRPARLRRLTPASYLPAYSTTCRVFSALWFIRSGRHFMWFASKYRCVATVGRRQAWRRVLRHLTGSPSRNSLSV